MLTSGWRVVLVVLALALAVYVYTQTPTRGPHGVAGVSSYTRVADCTQSTDLVGNLIQTCDGYGPGGQAAP